MFARVALISVIAGTLGILSACELEDDFEEVEQCVPGQLRCRTDGRLDACNDDGLWQAEGDFLCLGSCMVMDNKPSCM
jgi:hypothetical protein